MFTYHPLADVNLLPLICVDSIYWQAGCIPTVLCLARFHVYFTNLNMVSREQLSKWQDENHLEMTDLFKSCR